MCNMAPPPPPQTEPVIGTAAGRMLETAVALFSSGPVHSPPAFVGGLRSRGGTSCLVFVYVTSSSAPRGPKSRWLEFTAHPMVPIGPKPGQNPYENAISSYAAPVSRNQTARVLAGQRDPTDPSRFTIRFELDGWPGEVAGHLNDDGTVSFEATP